MLLDPEGLDVSVCALVREVVEKAVVAVDLVKLLRELLDLVGSVLNEFSGSYKLPLVGGLSHDDLVHVLVALEDLLNSLLAVRVDIL